MATTDSNLGATEFNSIRLAAFGKQFYVTDKVKESFQEIDEKKVTFISLQAVSISAAFLKEMIKGCLDKTEKIMFYCFTKDQEKLIKEAVEELEVLDRVSCL